MCEGIEIKTHYQNIAHRILMSFFNHCIYGCMSFMSLFNFVNYVILLLCLCMLCSVYSVSLCCSVYCFCVNICVNRIAYNKYIIYHRHSCMFLLVVLWLFYFVLCQELAT